MSSFFSPLVENAMRLSSYWHQGQKRKGSSLDYLTHLTAVAMILSRSDFDEEVIAAGFCHDLLEYTNCPPQEILTTCGQRVFNIVQALTLDLNLSPNEYWDIRKRKFIDTVKKSSGDIKAVAAADRIHNLQTLIGSLQDYGMPFFQYFHRGPEQILWFEDQTCMALQDSWQHPLVSELDNLVENLVEMLETLDQEQRQGITRQPLPREFSRAKKSEPSRIAAVVEKTPLKIIRPGQERAIPQIGVSSYEHHAKKMQSEADDPLLLKPKKETKPKLTKYLTLEETRLLLPAVLQTALLSETLTNQILQDKLQVNYLVSHRLLKELKRLHVIKRADSFKPRKVNKSRIKELLKEIKN